MVKYLAPIFLLAGCAGNQEPEAEIKADKIVLSEVGPVANYDRLKEYILSADSVVLFSHISPNEPYKNPNTGKYYPGSIPFIEDGKINYAISVQERKQLKQPDIDSLVSILILPAVWDSVGTLCFQPRNAVVVFKAKKLAYFDFCFDCRGVSWEGDFGSDLIMDFEKFDKLRTFYLRRGFKYELE